ncbi:MAG: 6-carboxytetrahydropterin synthase [Acidobacteria bacterium]|nr:6-carboxytetrahydropterin synthase [Acidobacteriota bacterium]MDW7983725.1 6-carboxytetrahydropterin synthase [Acidobacteriota bacterium]
MRLGIIEYIDSAHFLPGHPKCGRLHGHTYRVELVIQGQPDRGMIIDFADLKKKLREVLRVYDHRSWNEVLEYPSVENICVRLAQDLTQVLDFPFTLRVWEGHGQWAELSAPEDLS